MSDQPPSTGRSTIWDAKTRTKPAKRRTTVGRRKSLKEEIDDGFRYFWSRRKVSQYHST